MHCGRAQPGSDLDRRREWWVNVVIALAALLAVVAGVWFVMDADAKADRKARDTVCEASGTC